MFFLQKNQASLVFIWESESQSACFGFDWPLPRFNNNRQITVAYIGEPQLDAAFFVQRDDRWRIDGSEHPARRQGHIIQWAAQGACPHQFAVFQYVTYGVVLCL